jgi:hypothetical protein
MNITINIILVKGGRTNRKAVHYISDPQMTPKLLTSLRKEKNNALLYE